MTSTAPDYSAQLAVAIKAAEAAEQVINHYFDAGFEVLSKADDSPVTIADVEAENTIREMLLASFPGYGFYGEETGTANGESDFCWLVDPIDGTKSFVRRSPFFSTQIALMHRNELVVGVSNAPHFHGGQGEMVSACRGQEAKLQGQVVKVSGEDDLAKAFLSTGNLASLAAHTEQWANYGKLLTHVARGRGYGDFCSYHQLSCGQADLVIESDVNILDIAALCVVIEQAGGVFTQLDGKPITLETRSVLAASSRELHAQALQILQTEQHS